MPNEDVIAVTYNNGEIKLMLYPDNINERYVLFQATSRHREDVSTALSHFDKYKVIEKDLKRTYNIFVYCAREFEWY